MGRADPVRHHNGRAVRETTGAIGYVYQSEAGTLLGLKVLATVPTK